MCREDLARYAKATGLPGGRPGRDHVGGEPCHPVLLPWSILWRRSPMFLITPLGERLWRLTQFALVNIEPKS